MSMKATALNVDHSKNVITVYGVITLTGNYGTAGGALPHGDTLDLSQMGIPSNKVGAVRLWAAKTQSAAPLFDFYQYNPGTNSSNGVVQIIVGGAEMTPGAAYATTTPTNQPGFVLYFEAEFLALY